MKKLFVVVSFYYLLFVSAATAQHSLLNCKSLPMVSGTLTAEGPKPSKAGNLIVKSSSSEVYSLFNGIVLSIAKGKDIKKNLTYIVSVGYGNDTVVAYGNMSRVDVVKKQSVQRGQLIGKATRSEDAGTHSFRLMAVVAKDSATPMHLFSNEELVSFVKQADR